MLIGGHDVLLPTTMVGSWPRPLWMRGGVIRESVQDLDYVDMYQRTLYEDAVRLCVKDQDLAGLDIVTDGNQYFQGETPYDKIQILFVPLRLAGFRAYGPPGSVVGMEHYFRPVVAEKIRWVRPIFGPVLQAMKLATHKPFKININSGPATVASWCEDQFYGDAQALRVDIADAFNRELRWLAEHGRCGHPAHRAGLHRLGRAGRVGGRDDEPGGPRRAGAPDLAHVLRQHPPVRLRVSRGQRVVPGQAVQERPGGRLDGDPPGDRPAGDGRAGDAAHLDRPRRHASLGIGVIEVMNPHVETAEQVAARIRIALEHVPADRLIVSTDCGLYQLPRDVAFRKLDGLVAGTRIVRRELGRDPDGRTG